MFAGEPLVRVTAPLVEAQLVETWLLNRIASQTMLASKAARVALACGDRSFVDFSARRDHGVDAAMAAARAAWICGAAGHLAGGRRPPLRHPAQRHDGALVRHVLRRRARRLPGLRPHASPTPWCCSSTPTTRSRAPGGPPRWPTSWRPRASPSPGCASTRATWPTCRVRVRAVLDDAGLPRGRRSSPRATSTSTASPRCWPAGAPIDAFGVGTQLGTSADAPTLGAVYKLVEDADGPKMKLASGKVTLPGRKQVWRLADRDVRVAPRRGRARRAAAARPR